jgi:hypothetical protein
VAAAGKCHRVMRARVRLLAAEFLVCVVHLFFEPGGETIAALAFKSIKSRKILENREGLSAISVQRDKWQIASTLRCRVQTSQQWALPGNAQPEQG